MFNYTTLEEFSEIISIHPFPSDLIKELSDEKYLSELLHTLKPPYVQGPNVCLNKLERTIINSLGNISINDELYNNIIGELLHSDREEYIKFLKQYVQKPIPAEFKELYNTWKQSQNGLGPRITFFGTIFSIYSSIMASKEPVIGTILTILSLTSIITGLTLSCKRLKARELYLKE